MYFRNVGCFRYVIVNTVHEGCTNVIIVILITTIIINSVRVQLSVGTSVVACEVPTYIRNVMVPCLSCSSVAVRLWFTTGLASIYVPWPHCFV